MDSLVTLGSVSAFIMSIMLLVTYYFQQLIELDIQMRDAHNNLTDKHSQIMNIVHMFESAALILTVVTIGKYFEGRAKSTIL